MTQIGGFIPPARRPDVLGVHSLDHFSLTVPDMEKAKSLLWRLRARAARAGGCLAAPYGGQRPSLGHARRGSVAKGCITWRSAPSPTISTASACGWSALGIERLDPPTGFESNGLWCRDPDGTLVEIRVAEKSSPNAKAGFEMPSSPAGVAGAPEPQPCPLRAAAAPRPRAAVQQRRRRGRSASTRRFWGFACRTARATASPSCTASTAATITSSPSPSRTARACTTAAGTWPPSTRSASAPCRWRTRVLSVAGASAATCWAPTIFTMCRIPWGSFSEYSSDIDYIPCDQDWQPGDHPPHDAFYVWGPTPPEDFVKNYEAA